MAKFTFGNGNARAVLRAPLYAAGSLATRLVPRNPRLWIFASGTGPGEGALALYDVASRQLADRRLVWLCTSKTELALARKRGLDAELKTGLHGFWLTLRARVIVITHGFGDANRYAVRGAMVVQLWHGIPLKKLHLDSPAALRVGFLPDHPLVRRMLSVLYRRAGRQIGLFAAASALSAGRLRSAFGLKAEVLAVTGDPRDDVLLRGTAEERRNAARTFLESAVGALPPTVALYAPTWRDGAEDPGIPTTAEWLAIAQWLDRTDAALLIRSHPLGLGEYAAGAALSPRIRMLAPALLAEVTPVLPAVNVLVTDYSSIAYDYSLTGGPVIFFAPDVDRYESSRGLYEHYRDFSGGTHVASWAGVLELADGAGEDPRLLAQSRRLRTENFDFYDGLATERVLREILARIGETVPAGLLTGPRHPGKRIIIDSVEISGDPKPVLRIGGVTTDDTPVTAQLVGSRQRLDGAISVGAGAWQATIPLTVTRWSEPELAPPSGVYRLQLNAVGGTTVRVDVRATLPDETLLSLFRVSMSGDNGTLDVRFAAPLTDAELGPRNQRKLQRRYRRGRPAQAGVFFESFYSQVVACNPRAIDARLAIERPDVPRYWSTVDASVAVPAGAIRVLEGSAQWWNARGSARLIVVNDWLRKRYRRRPNQRVLQTWHGTMLKRLALDRAGKRLRAQIAVLRERARWDILLSQNPYSTRIFRSAYRFDGEIWEEGYPRDDAIIAGNGAGIRRKLGISDEARVVLYAPTWRDDRVKLVDYLDLPRFAAELGDGTVTLVRGHSRTLRHGPDIEGSHLLDVTTYPDVDDLLLIAEVLVTDYSSVMFDFTATGKPIVFFTPDLQHYDEELRGFYFDLIADAPGPVVSTKDDLIAALRASDTDATFHSERYTEWRARFNPRDDGHASARVVRRILDAGLLD